MMQRTPLSDETKPAPTYPARSAKWSRTYAWARRVGAVVSTSAVLGLAGCYTATPLEGTEPEDDAGVIDSGRTVTDSGGAPDADETFDATVTVDADAYDAEIIVDAEIVIDADPVIDAEVPAPVFDPCEPQSRLSGDAAFIEFMYSCGADMPAETPVVPFPFFGPAHTCGLDGDWVRVEITERRRVAASFTWGPGSLTADIYGPDGSLIVTLDEEHPCIQFDAEPGLWALAVRGGGSLESPVYFELAFENAYEDGGW